MRRRTATLGDAIVLAGMWTLSLVGIGFIARLVWWLLTLGWNFL